MSIAVVRAVESGHAHMEPASGECSAPGSRRDVPRRVVGVAGRDADDGRAGAGTVRGRDGRQPGGIGLAG